MATVTLAVLACVLALHTPAGAALEFGTAAREGAQLRLQWSGGAAPYQLEDAPSPGGPWAQLGNPMSEASVLVPMAHGERYFRIAGARDISVGEASMRATLAAIDTYSATVPRDDRAAWRSQMLGFLKARPDINDAGETPDGLWAITKDGIPLAFWNNRRADPPGEDDIVGVAGRSGTATPGKNPARFASTIGTGFTQAAPRLGQLLKGNGYATTNDDAQLESLKGTRNESILFFNTHGGICAMPRIGPDDKPITGPNGKVEYDPAYALWTGRKIDPLKTDYGYRHQEFVGELQAGRMALVEATASIKTLTGGVQQEVREWRFCITHEWVRTYMRFPAENHASVWLAVCRSGSTDAAPLRAAFRSVGAEMISTWTEEVDGKAVLAATTFAWDRLLGTNKVLPPATPQRPFDYPNVWDEMRSRGLHRHPLVDNNKVPIGTTDVVYEGATDAITFGVFAPSLAYVLVDEGDDKLHLIGLFGNPPAEDRKILIGGVECQAGADWSPRKIICTLPRTGAGSAGDVQIIVNDRKSNVRQLSRWTVAGDYKRTEPGTPFSMDGTLSLVFRADVGEYRKVPGIVFIRPTRYATAMVDSRVFIEAKGTQTEDCGDGGVDTTVWSGSGLFPIRAGEGIPDEPWHTLVGLSLNTIDHQAGLGIAFGTFDPTAGPLKLTYTPCSGGAFEIGLGPVPPGSLEEQQIIKSSTEETLPDGSDITLILPGKTFPFGSNWVISGDTMASPLSASFTWSAAVPEFPPDPVASR